LPRGRMYRGGFGNKKLGMQENATPVANYQPPATSHRAPGVNSKRIKKKKRGKTKDAIGGATSEPGVGEGGRRT
jgi:hypothetical protein